MLYSFGFCIRDFCMGLVATVIVILIIMGSEFGRSRTKTKTLTWRASLASPMRQTRLRPWHPLRLWRNRYKKVMLYPGLGSRVSRKRNRGVGRLDGPQGWHQGAQSSCLQLFWALWCSSCQGKQDMNSLFGLAELKALCRRCET